MSSACCRIDLCRLDEAKGLKAVLLPVAVLVKREEGEGVCSATKDKRLGCASGSAAISKTPVPSGPPIKGVITVEKSGQRRIGERGRYKYLAT